MNEGHENIISLAIVGSKNMTTWEIFEEGITQFIETVGQLPDQVVSGGDKGAYLMGAKWARDNGIKLVVFRPKRSQYGKKAGIMRNTDIVNAATHVLAFPSHNGKGTQDSIKKAEKQDKPCIILWID